MPVAVAAQKTREITFAILFFPLCKMHIVRQIPNKGSVSASSVLFQPKFQENDEW